MLGLRTKENQKFEVFFSKIQESAAELKRVFFLDAGDGNDFETADMEGEDLMGWLVPEERADEFKIIFENGGKIPDEWDDFYCWALWEGKEKIKIHFDSFDE